MRRRFKGLLAPLLLGAMISPAHATTLDVLSSTDASAIQPVIRAFEKKYPQIRVAYHELLTTQIYHQFRRNFANHTSKADILISSAMDLQTKLVNDGYALTYKSPYTEALPGWAEWRDQAFGFTFEPAVIVYNKKAFKGHALPSTHESLALLLREHPDFYRNRVGTYDIRRSGVGYLFATQDAVQSNTSARLLESLGRSGVKDYCCTSEVLKRIDNGTLILGYNLLGSYALKRAESDPRIGVIVPQDYTLVMSRIAMISAQTRHVEAAHRFIDFLLSPDGQQVIARSSGLIALRPDIHGPMSANGIRKRFFSNYQPIDLGPGLLVYLDQMKRAHFLQEWKSMMISQ